MSRKQEIKIFILTAIIIILSSYILFKPNNTDYITEADISQVYEQMDLFSDNIETLNDKIEDTYEELSLKKDEINNLKTQLQNIKEENNLLKSSIMKMESDSSTIQNVTDLEFESIYSNVFNSVVSIQVESLPENGVVSQKNPPVIVFGSGFIYNYEGYILTNHHIIDNIVPNSDIYIQFQDGIVNTAEIIDSDSLVDIAILKTDLPEGVRPLSLGNSSDVSVGQKVGVIGNPLGFGGSLSVGVISQLKRSIQVTESSHIPGLIQIDASVNPGNSGGPLINDDGEVIGMITLKLVGWSVEGMGYAIPSNLVQKVVTSLLETGEYNRPYMGIYITNITPRIQLYMRLPSTKGVLVVDVEEDSPADAAGLRGGDTPIRFIMEHTKIGGDVITRMDDQQIKDIDDLSYMIIQRSPGETITLTIIRDKEEIDIDLILGEVPDT
ncbi:MAG: trypsin-like peptidase domain-containing protein [Candidatus Helarchaeota archaeon]